MLLWNLRRSGFNVKKFVRNYIDTTADNIRYNDEGMSSYYASRWVTESANQTDGSGTFGRKAQRKVIIQSLQALVNSNQQIRDEESRVFNLLACPGYPELIAELKALNYDRGLTSFVVGDAPARLAADATTLSNWGSNSSGAVEDGDDGLVTSDEYVGVFYPWGFTSDNLGNDIVVPPSHMMLRTIALSDNVSYPWFAPAGTRRGGITNASAVGYVDAEGEFQSVALNNGQRDTLASIKVNPITFITGTGLVNYGQYTRALNASSLDRINVARLVVYLRRQFAQLAKPYVFEPNDKITRDEIKGAAESLLLELVGQRALYDYIVVCDTSNNTPTRIDRNELYLDVAIEPVKAVEFIYIPLRLKNTGEIQGLAQ
jgi:phage tail sheath protein FI